MISLQEHWLVQCQINLLGVIHEKLNYVGKGVDINNELQPDRLPRRYGGVGILWHQDIDEYVNTIPDGNERTQIIEVRQQDDKPLMIISVYMPTGGTNDKINEYHDTIDQLFEIIKKYKPSHYIVLGGDLNEGLSTKKSN